MTTGEKWMEILKWIFIKLTSARFLVLISLVGTLCILLLKSFDLLIANTTNEKVFAVLKDLFLVIFGAFIGFVGTAITFYFTRSDRKNANEETEVINTTTTEKKEKENV